MESSSSEPGLFREVKDIGFQVKYFENHGKLKLFCEHKDKLANLVELLKKLPYDIDYNVVVKSNVWKASLIKLEPLTIGFDETNQSKELFSKIICSVWKLELSNNKLSIMKRFNGRYIRVAELHPVRSSRNIGKQLGKIISNYETHVLNPEKYFIDFVDKNLNYGVNLDLLMTALVKIKVFITLFQIDISEINLRQKINIKIKSIRSLLLHLNIVPNAQEILEITNDYPCMQLCVFKEGDNFLDDAKQELNKKLLDVFQKRYLLGWSIVEEAKAIESYVQTLHNKHVESNKLATIKSEMKNCHELVCGFYNILNDLGLYSEKIAINIIKINIENIISRKSSRYGCRMLYRGEPVSISGSSSRQLTEL